MTVPVDVEEDEEWHEIDSLLFDGEVIRAIQAARRTHDHLPDAVQAIYGRYEYLKSTSLDRFAVPPDDFFKGAIT